MSSLLLSDNISRKWKCKYCNKEFRNHQGFAGHIKVHKEERRNRHIAYSSSSSSINSNGSLANSIVPTHFSNASSLTLLPSFAASENNNSFAVSRDINPFFETYPNTPFVMPQNHSFSFPYPCSSRFYLNNLSVLSCFNPYAVFEMYRFYDMEELTSAGILPQPSLLGNGELPNETVNQHLLHEVQVSSTYTQVFNGHEEEHQRELRELELFKDPVKLEISSDEEEEDDPDLDLSLYL